MAETLHDERPSMTQMLASVTTLQEALIALEAGVDIIDLKNPAEGALGALPLSAIRQIVVAIDGRKCISTTIGDLPMQPKVLLQSVKRVMDTGIDIIKVGFFANNNHLNDDSLACIRALKPVAAKGARLVAVMMADQNPCLELLSDFKRAGFYGVMLDTAKKDGNSLLEYILYENLQKFISDSLGFGLKVGLAGALKLEHISALVKLSPSYLGFRGAICTNLQRNSPISRFKVIEIKELLYKSNKTLSNAAYA
jgi:uncharacterized protein (UPF0264 family)